MASKYDAVLPKLPALPAQDLDYQAKVESMKAILLEDRELSASPMTLAKELEGLRVTKELCESQISDLNLQIEAVSQLLIESHDSDAPEWGTYGATSNTLRLVDGSSVRVQKEPYAQVVDKDANREWAKKQGLERLLALPWQTINSFTKEALLKGMPEPDGVTTYAKTKIVFTKAKSE